MYMEEKYIYLRVDCRNRDVWGSSKKHRCRHYKNTYVMYVQYMEEKYIYLRVDCRNRYADSRKRNTVDVSVKYCKSWHDPEFIRDPFAAFG